MKQVRHGGFNTYRVGKNKIVEVEFKWCFGRESLEGMRLYIIFLKEVYPKEFYKGRMKDIKTIFNSIES
jgi:hypothetical protein